MTLFSVVWLAAAFIPAGWRAQETYKIISLDQFIETFELAGPGKDFEIYSEGRLTERNRARFRFRRSQ